MFSCFSSVLWLPFPGVFCYLCCAAIMQNMFFPASLQNWDTLGPDLAGPLYFLKRRPIQELHIGNFSCSGDLLRNSVGHKKSDGFVQPPLPKKKTLKTFLRWTFQGFASSFSLGYRKEVLWEPFNDGQQMLWEELKKLLKPNEKTTSLRCVPCRSRDLEPCSWEARCKRGMSCLRVVEVVVVRFFG